MDTDTHRSNFCVLFFLIFLLLPSERVAIINDDGAWSWFEDDRAIIHEGKVIVGSAAAGTHEPGRRGDIEVVTYEIATGRKTLFELHDALLSRRNAYDDHNSPALLVRPDGRILAVYSKHSEENCFYYRISSRSGDTMAWGEERVFVPSEKSRITYSNLHRLSYENGGRGRIYNFYRGLDDSFKPSYAWSDDVGETWTSGGIFIQVPAKVRHRPYVKYASNGVDTVHMFYTEGHPRNFDNSAYHVYYRGGNLHRTDGSVIRALAEGTRIFQGDADNVAWVSDIHLDAQGRPRVAYSVQKNSGGLPPGQGGDDHRYRYARWTGAKWEDHEIAYAGSRLYAGEDDYTGNIALDPDNPDVVFISANVDPATGRPLTSKGDGQCHYEIFQGVTKDGRAIWTWSAVTRDSNSDNIRPIVPKWDHRNRALLWLRGKYISYTNYDLEVVGTIGKR